MLFYHSICIVGIYCKKGFPGGTSGKESACQSRRPKCRGFDPWVGKIPWSMKWQPAPVFLSGKFYGQRSLAGYSPWSCRESEHNVRKSFLFSPVLKYGLMDFCFIQCIEFITVIIYFNASDCFRIV